MIPSAHMGLKYDEILCCFRCQVGAVIHNEKKKRFENISILYKSEVLQLPFSQELRAVAAHNPYLI